MKAGATDNRVLAEACEQALRGALGGAPEGGVRRLDGEGGAAIALTCCSARRRVHRRAAGASRRIPAQVRASGA
jgi:hypothetical protein